MYFKVLRSVTTDEFYARRYFNNKLRDLIRNFYSEQLLMRKFDNN